MKDDDLFKDPLPESLRKTLEIAQKVTDNVDPLFKEQQRLQKMFSPVMGELNTDPFLESYTKTAELAQKLTASARPFIEEEIRMRKMLSPLIDTLPMMHMTDVQARIFNDSAIRMLSNFSDPITKIIDSPFYKWINEIKPFDDYWSKLQEIYRWDFDVESYRKKYFQAMYDAKWFPYTVQYSDASLLGEINDILSRTPRSRKRREQLINKAIFSYYTRDVVENMKKEWRKLEIPEHLMRILHQAVQAYHRKEYAITVIVLSTQWEGIIYNKAHDDGRKVTSKTKKYLKNLVEENNYQEIFKSYYDEFIMYNCNSPEETIEDVPGRNEAAHSFYNKYPTKKAALNAILFTDFLLDLEPLEEG